MLDGVKEHDLPGQLGLPEDECSRIWNLGLQARTYSGQPEPTDEEIRHWQSECADLTLLGAAEHYWSYDLEEEAVISVVRAAFDRWGRGKAPFPAMRVCPECGNKRCPKATLHTLECTGSNEPGSLFHA